MLGSQIHLLRSLNIHRGLYIDGVKPFYELEHVRAAQAVGRAPMESLNFFLAFLLSGGFVNFDEEKELYSLSAQGQEFLVYSVRNGLADKPL
jgi:hypothetical protein